MIDINTIRKIAEFNTEVALFKRKKDFIIDDVKLKNLLIKYDQCRNLLIKQFPKVRIDTMLLNPNTKELDVKKLDINQLARNIYINT